MLFEPVMQGIVDSGLPAFAGRLECGENIRSETNVDRFLWFRKPWPACSGYGRLSLLAGESIIPEPPRSTGKILLGLFRGSIRVNPFGLRIFGFLFHWRTSWK